MKTVRIQLQLILNASGLRVYCENNSQVPNDEHKLFVPYYYMYMYMQGDSAETPPAHSQLDHLWPSWPESVT